MTTFVFERNWHSETVTNVEADSIEEAIAKVKAGDCEWEDNFNNDWPEDCLCTAYDDKECDSIVGEWKLDTRFDITEKTQ